MNQPKYYLQLLTLLLLLLVACQNNSTTAENNSTEAESNEQTMTPVTETTSSSDEKETMTTPEAAPAEGKEMLYAWVSKLNIRDQPNLKGKTIASVTSDEAMTFMGAKSDKAETIVLRGVAYHDSWYKISKADGTEGWVYGGAVKRKGEQKGNAPLTEMKFDYPKFGKYDLSNWELINIEELGDEVDGEAKSYKSSDYIFNNSNSEIGEFGYSFRQSLTTDMGVLIKKREFNFMPSGSPDEAHELVETIENHEQSPSKKYTRTQKIDKHYYDLNAKPMLVLGEWTEEVIKKAK